MEEKRVVDAVAEMTLQHDVAAEITAIAPKDNNKEPEEEDANQRESGKPDAAGSEQQ